MAAFTGCYCETWKSAKQVFNYTFSTTYTVMKKAFIILIFYYLSIPALKAQQQYYNWYITAGPGAMAYYGDLTHTTIEIGGYGCMFT